MKQDGTGPKIYDEILRKRDANLEIGKKNSIYVPVKIWEGNRMEHDREFKTGVYGNGNKTEISQSKSEMGTG